MRIKRLSVLTSGGDAPGMNAAIRAVVKTAIYNKVQIVGFERGYAGLLKEEFIELNISAVEDIIHRGGTILKTSRCEEMRTEKGINDAFGILKRHSIDGLVVIGGNGSFMGANKLGIAGINIMGIPGTIDNDLSYTDYTIGFDTAVNTVVEAIAKIRDTSMAHDRVTIIEVMGRYCGDIALYSGLAGGADSILVPEEEKYGLTKICDQLIESRQRGKTHNIIMLAEGRESANELQKEILEKTGIETRIMVMGYLQRGGIPSAVDRILASRMGAKAVDLLIDGKSNRLIGIRNNHIIDRDIVEALAEEKRIDKDMYNLARVLSM